MEEHTWELKLPYVIKQEMWFKLPKQPNIGDHRGRAAKFIMGTSVRDERYPGSPPCFDLYLKNQN